VVNISEDHHNTHEQKNYKLNFQNVNKHGNHIEIGFSVLQIRFATAQDPHRFLDKKLPA
jgi:hypothetical protein